MSDSYATEPSSLHARLRARLPEILIEAGSVVIAVLLAQAAAIWHEQKQQDELASQAHAAVVSEMRGNEAQLDALRASMKRNIASLQAMTLDRKTTSVNVSIDMSLALLSEAAWRAALDTGAVQHVDFAWTMKVAQVYELQELVLHAQSGVVDELGDLSSDSNELPEAKVSRLLSRERSLAGLADNLDVSYREALADKH